ncbi:C2 domain protein, partial [Ancylostoma caninum]
QSINSTDAFVEIRFADEVQKTEVVTSLNPQWDSELFPFDTDEKQLVECWLQFRVMDHDTYSANDAIGRVNLDCNILVEKMRMQEMERLDETHILPIYDTLNGGLGNRGELTFRIKLQLLVDTDFKNYVQILSGYQVPFDYRVIEIVGLMHELKSEKDPDYEWLDRIRTPKATNEARQSAIRDALRSAAVSLAHKVNKHQCNLICGYQEYLDVEGSSTDLFTVRVLGTALRIEKGKYAGIWSDRVSFPLMSLSEIPGNRQCGIGAIVAVRAVHILEDDDEEPEATRKSWWNELRSELHQQAVAVGCNMVIGYSEQFAVNDGIALLGCSGTAVVMGREEEATLIGYKTQTDSELIDRSKETREKRTESSARQPILCSRFHTPLQAGRTPFNVTTQVCSTCRTGSVTDFLISTTSCPPPHYLLGPKLFIQVM